MTTWTVGIGTRDAVAAADSTLTVGRLLVHCSIAMRPVLWSERRRRLQRHCAKSVADNTGNANWCSSEEATAVAVVDCNQPQMWMLIEIQMVPVYVAVMEKLSSLADGPVRRAMKTTENAAAADAGGYWPYC